MLVLKNFLPLRAIAMPPASLERRYTLDELFGPDPFKAELESLRIIIENHINIFNLNETEAIGGV
jgi:hypothetical protein